MHAAAPARPLSTGPEAPTQRYRRAAPGTYAGLAASAVAGADPSHRERPPAAGWRAGGGNRRAGDVACRLADGAGLPGAGLVEKRDGGWWGPTGGGLKQVGREKGRRDLPLV